MKTEICVLKKDFIDLENVIEIHDDEYKIVKTEDIEISPSVLFVTIEHECTSDIFYLGMLVEAYRVRKINR